MSSKLDDPEWRRQRARNAGLASSSPEALARRLVAGWPKLTAEQRTRIRAVLRPVVAPDSRDAA